MAYVDVRLYTEVGQIARIQPNETSNVTVHYHGTLIDGRVFDSSYDRGETISFGLNQVISGWTEGLQLMDNGAKYRFFIPFNMKLFLRDENNNIIAEAEVDVKNKTIAGIGFFKIEYADGSTTGSTNFQHKKLHIFEALLQQYLP